MNVLVLEDDCELSTYLASGLAELGHRARLVASGDEALALLGHQHFDVAVLDRMVPGLDGLSVMKQAREAGCLTPILMLTALGGSRTASRRSRVGPTIT